MDAKCPRHSSMMMWNKKIFEWLLMICVELSILIMCVEFSIC